MKPMHPKAESEMTPTGHEPLMQELEEEESKTMDKKVIIGVYVLLALIGIGTGYLLSSGATSGSMSTPKVTKTANTVGVNDTETFKDTAEGIIEKGGVGGEGTHTLIREGGVSQTACLVSSVLDLDEYTGKKVKVWSRTEASQKCGWFMDVGRLEVQ